MSLWKKNQQNEDSMRGKGQNNYKTYKKINKMTVLITSQDVIILNVNGLNSPIKRHRMAEWLKTNKKRSSYMLSIRHSPQT